MKIITQSVLYLAGACAVLGQAPTGTIAGVARDPSGAAGVDGKPALAPLPQPILPMSVTIGGIPAEIQYTGGAHGPVAGVMQANVQIPGGVQPGGYVPVVLQVGDRSTTPGAVWIAVAGN
jgi:uncharacterized protein (TIGR03437 family)